MKQAYQLHCQIQTTSQGIILKIWETLSEQDEARIHRSSAFLFRLNFRVETVEAANHLLRKYLWLIGISEVQEMATDEIQFINIIPGVTEEFMPDPAVDYDRSFGRNV